MTEKMRLILRTKTATDQAKVLAASCRLDATTTAALLIADAVYDIADAIREPKIRSDEP